jgi:shikimate kinase
MKATAICNGAATIVAAFACGKGGAYGIGLENRTTVELDGSRKVKSIVNGKPGVGIKLAEASVKRALKRFNQRFTGARVVTETDIPTASGLKSSSVAANSIVLATIGAIALERGEIRLRRLNKSKSSQEIWIGDREVTPEEIINIGIDAAFDAKVTVTGALDDASASFLGGYTLTDNLCRRIEYHGGMEESLKVLIHVPKRKIYSGKIDVRCLKPLKKEVKMIWDEARAGRIYSAITMNGMIHSAAFNLDLEPTLRALEAGAIAAGLSGTGPATVALTRGNPAAIMKAWKKIGGNVIQTTINNQKAEVLL